VTDPAIGEVTPAPPDEISGGAVVRPAARGRSRYSVLTRSDKLVLGLMVGIPAFLVFALIWVPTIASFFLSFTNWRGITAITANNIVGLKNYETLFTGYLFFWPAVLHNLMWLLFFLLVATPIGILFAVLLDREIRGSRFYQTAFYLPVVLSLALIGFIWELQYAPETGFINNALGRATEGQQINWLGDPSLNIWAVIVAASWRQVGYVMLLYLAGLKSVDPALREAAAIDGASERQTFFRVIFPVMAPINIVIFVITVIESLRAFDLAYIINAGKNGLELLSTLITNNSISEASLVGFGSSIAVVLLVISLGPIIFYLNRVMKEQR
jgi:multiple sugar transport system permease protein